MITLLILILTLLVYLVVAPVLLLFGYVLRGFALWRLAKQTEACKPGYAWIPVVQSWVLGKCAEACETERERKQYPWGKILLIFKIVHISCIVFMLPLGILLSVLGAGTLTDLLGLVAVACTVLSVVCTYKIYHYYVGDPADIIFALLHMQYGLGNLGLLIVSFIKPRAKKVETLAADLTDTEL